MQLFIDGRYDKRNIPAMKTIPHVLGKQKVGENYIIQCTYINPDNMEYFRAPVKMYMKKFLPNNAS